MSPALQLRLRLLLRLVPLGRLVLRLMLAAELAPLRCNTAARRPTSSPRVSTVAVTATAKRCYLRWGHDGTCYNLSGSG